MREVVFHVLVDRPGHLEARAPWPPLAIAAPSFEELQHEAREALIEHFGAAHGAYRVRLQRQPSAPISPLQSGSVPPKDARRSVPIDTSPMLQGHVAFVTSLVGDPP